MVYHGAMSRTNIDIDDELIERVMRRYRLPSKRAAVELALRRLAGEPMSRDEALASCRGPEPAWISPNPGCRGPWLGG
jgi:Arc/MetJ family transcription regulator